MKKLLKVSIAVAFVLSSFSVFASGFGSLDDPYEACLLKADVHHFEIMQDVKNTYLKDNQYCTERFPAESEQYVNCKVNADLKYKQGKDRADSIHKMEARACLKIH